MNTLANETTSASFSGNRITVRLSGGVALSFPIAGNWRFEGATPKQLSNVEVDEDGLHWPDLDEDLSFAGLLRGDYGQFVKRPANAEQLCACEEPAFYNADNRQ